MKTWAKTLIILFLAGIAALVYVYFFVYNKPHKDYLRAVPEVYISAGDLYHAFASDPAAAAGLYNGRILQIDGMLSTKESADELVILAFIFSDGFFGPEGVRCTMLPLSTANTEKPAIGDYVKIKGLCSGFTGADVILDHCSIVE